MRPRRHLRTFSFLFSRFFLLKQHCNLQANDVLRKVCGIALIDSSHRIAGLGYGMSKVSKTLYDVAEKRSVNWKHSNLPINTPLPSSEGAKNLASGTQATF
jgi:hypothetical protein